MVEFITEIDFKTIIKVIGVGGGGTNAVNNMYNEGIRDVSFVVCNTDKQSLDNSPVPEKIQLGVSLTEGLGAGNNPKQGANAAREAQDDIKKMLESTKMIFITAGMGGGTGTGAAPIIAQIAKNLNILTVAVVTIPFAFEGLKRIEQAIEGMKELQQYVDAMIVIDNNKIIELYGDLEMEVAFKKADEVLLDAVRSIAEIITVPGYINVDFADVKTVLTNSGVAIMGTGIGEGENKAINAAKQAINAPLLNIQNFSTARKLLVNITHPKTFKTAEMSEITSFLQKELGKQQADIIWGNVKDENLAEDKVKVTVIATGFNANIIPEVRDLISTGKENNSGFAINIANNEEITDEQWQENTKKQTKAHKSQAIEDFSNPNKIKKYSDEPAYIRLNITDTFFRKFEQ